MVRAAWSQREAQAKQAKDRLVHELAGIDKQIDSLLGRIVETTNDAVVRAYETKIADLQRHRAKLNEKSAAAASPKGRVEDFIELSLHFLANPWNLWASGD